MPDYGPEVISCIREVHKGFLKSSTINTFHITNDLDDPYLRILFQTSWMRQRIVMTGHRTTSLGVEGYHRALDDHGPGDPDLKGNLFYLNHPYLIRELGARMGFVSNLCDHISSAFFKIEADIL